MSLLLRVSIRREDAEQALRTVIPAMESGFNVNTSKGDFALLGDDAKEVMDLVQEIAKRRSNPLAYMKAHELTLSEYASQVQVQPLTNHGRRWEVILPGRDRCFSDADSQQGAIEDAHRGAVNNALLLNTHDSAELGGTKPTLPPQHVISAYPDILARFPELTHLYQ